jgi:proteasome lid subunit RPN8/RPN11
MRIDLAREIETRLRDELRKAGKREIGGMLLAEQLAPGRFRIVDFSVDANSGSHATFRRDPLAHRQAVEAFFERTGQDFARFNYLGEWHSHPSFSVRPSVDDIRTMTEMVEEPHSAISFAALLIVRLRLWWISHSLTIFACGHAPRATQIRPRITML